MGTMTPPARAPRASPSTPEDSGGPPETMPARILLFDLDGTLVLTGGAGVRALDRVFQDLYGLKGAGRGVPFRGRTEIGRAHV